jgi:hypothetical protein
MFSPTETKINAMATLPHHHLHGNWPRYDGVNICHLTEREAEAQKASETCPRSLSK